MTSKTNNGFTPIYLLILIVVLSIGFVSYSYVKDNFFNKSSQQINESPLPSTTPTQTPTPTPKPTIKATIKAKATSTPTNSPAPTSTSSIPKYIPNGSSSLNTTVTPTNSASNTNTSGTITVSTTSVNVTLSRANAQYSMVYGSGFNVTSQGATGWQIHYNQGTSGQGFDLSSGGISPGNSTTIRSYINTNKTNGTYSGSAVVEYYKDGSWQSGPTVSYTITLTD